MLKAHVLELLVHEKWQMLLQPGCFNAERERHTDTHTYTLFGRDIYIYI